MFRRSLLMMFFVVPCLIFGPGCSPSPSVWPEKPGIKVLATFTPIYCFTAIIAGDDANVMCLMTATDPHEAEPTPQDLIKVRTADLVLANGLGLEDRFLAKLIGSASKKVKLIPVGDVLAKKHHELLDDADHDDAEHDHDHGSHDPHIWLGPDRAKVMVDIIAKSLSQTDPAKTENYFKRALELKEKIAKLKAYGLDQFKGKKNRNIVTQHDSLGYFAKEFNLNIVGHIRSQKGQEEGTPEKHILAWKEKGKQPAVFTYEPAAYTKKEVDTIRASLKKEGIDASEAEIDTIETATIGDSGNPDPNYYLDKMKQNIDNLAKALP